MPGNKKGNDKDKNPYYRINTQGGIAPTKPKAEETEKSALKEPNPEKKVKRQSPLNESSYPMEPKVKTEKITNEPVVNIDEDEEVSGFTASIVLNSPMDVSKNTKVPTEQTEINESAAASQSSQSSQLLKNSKLPVETLNQLQKNQNITPDQSELLKKYIALKEQEIKDLKEQQRLYQSQWKSIRQNNDELTHQNRELLEAVQSHRSMEEQLKSEMHALIERHQGELALAKNDFEDQIKRSGNSQEQMQDLLRQKDIWKDKVREDLKRIKLKEKELENKYELLKRDTQTLLDSKDRHVLELKKKNDALELELETLEERLRIGNAVFDSIESKKRRLVETLKLAISLLEAIDTDDVKESEDKRKLG